MSAPPRTAPPTGPCSEGAGRPSYEYHPLEVVPFFRRFRPSLARDLVYTLVWNCALGAVYLAGRYAMGSRGITAEVAAHVMLISNCIGFSIHGLFVLSGHAGLDRRMHRRGGLVVAGYYTVVATLGVIAGIGIASLALELPFARWVTDPRWLAAVAVNSLVISALISAVFFVRERSARSRAEIERERARTERIEREAAIANLRALQAQIEPHFLFNTLANVASLVDPDPAKAKGMLESFIRFLRASLAATRSESTTLGEEAELIGAYLEVLQVRMGPRLACAIEVEPALAGYRLPPMLLQPVVENAIRHGLEPKVDGGLVSVRARREGAEALIEIADTGVGFAAATQGGVGLTNLRDRLRLLYGERARLEIRDNAPAGAIVTLRLPA